jgi:hypothetical protein
MYSKAVANVPEHSRKNEILDSMDWFAKPVHTFNFEGRTRIHSPVGVFCSIIIYSLMLLLIADRTFLFVFGIGPSISTYRQAEQWSSKPDAVNTNSF